jgi:replication factor A1
MRDVILLKSFPIKTLRFKLGPSGERETRSELVDRWYLLVVADKYGLDKHQFIKCFPHVSVECRQKTKDDALFLITRDNTVIAQISLTGTVLSSLSQLDLNSYPWNESTRSSFSFKTTNVQIKDITRDVKRANLRAKVVEKSQTKGVYSKYDGSPKKLSIATISDDTGSIKMQLWNDQIDRVSVDDIVEIENGRVKMFRGRFQINIGRNSKLNVFKPLKVRPKLRSRQGSSHIPLLYQT